MQSIISISNLSKSFHHKVALEQVTLAISEGEVFGFLGPSGAGKTTTINILTGQMKPDNGTAMIFGKDCQQILPDDLRQIGIMSDSVGFYEKMTVMDNLTFFAKFHGVEQAEVEQLLKKLDLYDARNSKAEKLSTGMKQRLLLIRAILHRPKILFLDEPTSGLDPSLSRKVHEMLMGLKEEGTTIFLTTHDMEEATKLCDRIALLHKGKLVEYGRPQEIIQKHSQEEMVELTYDNGRKRIVAKSELSEYLSQHVTSIHTLTTSLEDIFIKLTGEQFNVK
jgi:ABC-2 type transport system ATP-binding protein